MAELGTVGKIDNYHTNVHLEWILPISALVHRPKSIISPKFCFSDTSCYIQIHYFRESECKTWLCITVFAMRAISNGIATFNVIIKDLRNTTEFGPITCNFLKTFNHQRCDIYDLFKLEDVKQFKKENQCNGTFRIYLNLATGLPPTSNSKSPTASELSRTILFRDFEDLLFSEKKSDVIIEVQGKIFKAHKLILGTRSPVFAAMFEHTMTEKEDGIVKIDDCDPDTFQHFLKCIYTSKIENMSPNDILSLYTVADKYCVTELKEKCSELLEQELSVDTVCDVLIMAEMRKDNKLMNIAETFIVENNREILVTDKWKILMTEHSLIAAEILMKVVPINSS